MKKGTLNSAAKRGTLITALAFALLGSRPVAPPRERVLHSFNDGKDGYWPQAGLIFDSTGNLYGTTYAGAGTGVAYELTPNPHGGWDEIVLHNFKALDGTHPYAGLVLDPAGNLYGTALNAGSHGGGTAFELSLQSGGWAETVLHNFQSNNTDGIAPYGGLVFDSIGNLYGTTVHGGSYGYGTVFELSPQSNKGWLETILYNFQSNGHDGNNPYATLSFDTAGNLYGTTQFGGDGTCQGGCGVVYELTPNIGAGWSEQVLHGFQNDGRDGTFPYANLTFDTTGNLYGTTSQGGTGGCANGVVGCGVVFELSPQSGGSWSETVLHEFQNISTDGFTPYSSLIIDMMGNLYGTTYSGGSFGYGTVFELLPQSGGTWAETVLHNFQINGRDGSNPQAGLVFDTAGNLYGTTVDGGRVKFGYGTVFEIMP